MESYKTIILQAIIIFPFIALLITFPFMIINYKKYGSINKMRILIIYSFVLYLLCAYFLVILPLPSYEYVKHLHTPKTQLILFNFISDIIKDKNLTSILQVLFNILITVPFGFYLRYYNKFTLKKTILFSFLLSLFFELTQLSGLYGIYSRSYRLFDVDDLMFNTFGGLLGYFLLSLFKNILPTRESIDNESFKMGKIVTGLRRLVAFTIDNIIIFIIIIFYILSLTIYDKPFIFLTVFKVLLIVSFIFIVIFPILFSGSTIGKKMVSISLKNNKSRLYQIITRSLFVYIIFYIMPLYIYILLTKHPTLSLLLFFIYIIYLNISFVKLLTNKQLWYEKLTRTNNVSTIK